MKTIQKECVVSIFIPKQGFVRQGKFCFIDGKPCFVANMTERKWWRNFSGYSIAKRILEVLPKGIKIIYKREDLNTYYETTKSKFLKKGIPVSYGNHSQFVLPISAWKIHNGKLENEPKNLPILNLEKALKQEKTEEDEPVPTMEEYLKARLRLKRIWESRF